MSSGSHHLESVPCSTPVAHARGHPKTREYAYVADDLEMYKRVVENAEQSIELVPIRLDMENESVKLRDVFCYNKHEKMITPEMVAEALCEDLDLPINSFLPAIAQSIHQQIEAHSDSAAFDAQLTDQRAIVKLNIHVGNQVRFFLYIFYLNQSLVDQFEWDMSDEHNNPEDFAKKLCSELGLGGEFMSAIAYSIRGKRFFGSQIFWKVVLLPFLLKKNPYKKFRNGILCQFVQFSIFTSVLRNFGRCCYLQNVNLGRNFTTIITPGPFLCRDHNDGVRFTKFP